MKRRMFALGAVLAAVAVTLGAFDLARMYAQTLLGIGKAATAEIAELSLEPTIRLGDVRGRIDHLAVDLVRKRAFVAELGNGSVGVADLATGKAVKRLEGFHEPQDVAYAPARDRLFVGDGRVRVYGGDDLAPVGEIALGDGAHAELRLYLPR